MSSNYNLRPRGYTGRNFGGMNYGNAGINSYNPPNPAIDFDALYAARRKKEATSLWYNTADTYQDGVDPHSIYMGEARSTVPLWQQKVLDRDERAQKRQLYAEGKISKEDADFAGWHPEFYEDFKNWYDDATHGRLYQKTAASGIITSQDNKTINLAVVMDQILGQDMREFTLEGAVNRVAAPNLRLSVDTWAGFGIERDVPEGVEALTQKGKYTRQEIALTKDVSHIVQTDEAMYESDRDLMAQHIRHSAQKFRETKALKVATALESAADTAGADWAAFTSDHNTTNPLDQLGALMDTIEANGGRPNTIASHMAPFRDFISNTFVKGLITPGGAVQTGSRVIGNVPGLPGVTWYVDNLKTSTLVTVYDREAVLLVQGPVRTETYRDPRHGWDGFITRDWNRVWILDPTLIADLTGVHA